ncbi:hypothetical protein A3SI_14054 [Nitritalea halalkaliphila LW7]|uniref:Uncharacterized protein n=1 Tax=Nitritalea halalkaliphila LW7 TaxID=1189621 RepID=I5C096_9BACT|nr:hypothetical protein [Nitritalea halalkaliphila]EIM75248.1 hypothetical protein A3SI_14054 [Nitritalea halalkaliphila LW7]
MGAAGGRTAYSTKKQQKEPPALSNGGRWAFDPAGWGDLDAGRTLWKGLLPQAEEGQALATRTAADEAGGQKALLPPPLIQPAPDSSEDPATQAQAAAAVPSAQDLKVAEREVAEKEPQRTASPSIRTEVVRPSQPLPVSAPKRTLPEQEMFRVDLNGSLVADSKAGNGLGGRMAETRSEKRSGFRLIEEEMDGDVRVLRIPGIGERIQQAIAQAEPRPRPLGLRSLQEAKNEFLEGLFEKNME